MSYGITDTANYQNLAEMARLTLDSSADNYAGDKTYAVGDFVRYLGDIYFCKTAITEPEVFTPSHWKIASWKPNEMTAIPPQIFSAGRKKHYDEFWDAFQNNGNTQSYRQAFASTCFKDANYAPKYTLVSSNCQSMYYQCTGITDTKQEIVVNSSASTSFMFYSASNLKTIRKITVCGNGFPTDRQAFMYLYALENVEIVGNTPSFKPIQNTMEMLGSTKLTYASLLSIFNAVDETKTGQHLTIPRLGNYAKIVPTINASYWQDGSYTLTYDAFMGKWMNGTQEVVLSQKGITYTPDAQNGDTITFTVSGGTVTSYDTTCALYVRYKQILSAGNWTITLS